MIWAGDFNRHHPLWDRDEDTHLFTASAQIAADRLVKLLADHDMVMPLPKGIPTLQHMRSKRHSRPDNVFCTPKLQDMILRCEVDPELRPPCTDHYPIITHLTLSQARTSTSLNYNFRDTDWDSFRKELDNTLKALPRPAPIETVEDLSLAAATLTNTIQATIRKCVKRSKPWPDAKRWWNSDLRKMKKELNKLRSDSYRLRALTNHPAHRLMRDASNRYGEEIISAKRQHWSSYLEDMDASGIWTVNRYLKDPVGDGGNPRIPTMMTTDEEGRQIETNENQSKATLFAKMFFPPPPATTNIPQNYQYPTPLPDPPPITRCQIERQIRRLSPYKAYGPDEIPNIVLQRCLDLIIDYLYHIYSAIIKLGAYYNPWREFTTVVLRKPGKPNY